MDQVGNGRYTGALNINVGSENSPCQFRIDWIDVLPNCFNLWMFASYLFSPKIRSFSNFYTGGHIHFLVRRFENFWHRNTEMPSIESTRISNLSQSSSVCGADRFCQLLNYITFLMDTLQEWREKVVIPWESHIW